MKFRVRSKVNCNGIIIYDQYVQEYDDKENVFGRVLIYRQRMKKIFPNCEYKLIKAEEIK